MVYENIEVTTEVHETLEHMAVRRGCSIDNELWFSLYQLMRNPRQLAYLERRARSRQSDDEWSLSEEEDDEVEL